MQLGIALRQGHDAIEYNQGRRLTQRRCGKDGFRSIQGRGRKIHGNDLDSLSIYHHIRSPNSRRVLDDQFLGKHEDILFVFVNVRAAVGDSRDVVVALSILEVAAWMRNSVISRFLNHLASSRFLHNYWNIYNPRLFGNMSGDDEVEVPGLELAEDDPMRSFLPQSFGKKAKGADVAAQLERSKRTVDKSATTTGTFKKAGEDDQNSSAQEPASKGDGSSSDGDTDDSDESEDEFPVSHELVLKTHERAVTTASLDPAGSRLITGSTDCTLKFHDFASMTPTTLRAFKSVDPSESKTSTNSETHPINHVEFNPLSGGSFLCVSAHPQAKIMSRDGEVIAEFVKGDMYLRDMNNTKGHVSEVTTGTWNPVNRDICVTAGTDSTLRIWDVNFRRSQKEVIVHKSRAAGSAGRTRMTAVAWGCPLQGGNNVLVAAALDGSLVMWSGDGPHARPAAEIREAHKANTWTGGIDISAGKILQNVPQLLCDS